MQINTFTVGPIEVNCHLIWHPSTKQGLVIDPGDDGNEIIQHIKQLDVIPQAILLTHAHVDHIRGVGEVAEEFSCQVWLHQADHHLYLSPANALLPWLPAAENLPPPRGQLPEGIQGLTCTVLETPGHSPGSCCFYFQSDDVIFCGDTLFAGSIGRTDLPGGDHQTLSQSICRRILPLPDSTRIFPGHGPSTTISMEKRSNPFLQGSQPK